MKSSYYMERISPKTDTTHPALTATTHPALAEDIAEAIDQSISRKETVRISVYSLDAAIDEVYRVSDMVGFVRLPHRQADIWGIRDGKEFRLRLVSE